MEEAGIAAIALLAIPAAMIVADLFGLCAGLGWGYYSKRRKAKRQAEVQADD